MAIQIRRGTNTEWESNNSNIVVGEPAIATDAERFFVGTASGDFAEFANLDIIAPAYNTSTSYVVGDITNYHGKLYSCNAPCSGAFNISYWDEKSLAEILKDLESEINYAQYEIGYANGKLITIDNGASEIPVKDLTLDIDAVQDLHGYDYPWVGGAGKNLCPYPFQDGSSKTMNGITFTANADGSIKINGTATAVAQFFIKIQMSLKAGTYTLSGFPSTMPTGANTYMRVYSASASLALSDYPQNKSERTRTLSQDVTDVLIWVSIASGDTVNNVTIYPMLELGSTASSFVPYANICPISGWDEVNVNVSGVNIWDEEWELGSLNFGTGQPVSSSSTIRSKNYINVLPNTRYFAKTPSTIYVFFYDSSHSFITVGGVNNTLFDSPNNAYYMKLIKDGTTYNHDISINYPSTDHDYHAYNGQTYTIDLNGTRYGGTLDVTTGVLTLTHGFVDLGTIGWTTTTVGTNIPIFYSDIISDRKSGSGDLVCSNYKTIAGNRGNLSNNDFSIVDYNGGNQRVAIRDSNYNNATTAEFKTAMDGVQLVYELATPQVVQLTPTQVRTVLGTNNLWNQMNSNNELAYRISNALN